MQEAFVAVKGLKNFLLSWKAAIGHTTYRRAMVANLERIPVVQGTGRHYRRAHDDFGTGTIGYMSCSSKLAF